MRIETRDFELDIAWAGAKLAGDAEVTLAGLLRPSAEPSSIPTWQALARSWLVNPGPMTGQVEGLPCVYADAFADSLRALLSRADRVLTAWHPREIVRVQLTVANHEVRVGIGWVRRRWKLHPVIVHQIARAAVQRDSLVRFWCPNRPPDSVPVALERPHALALRARGILRTPALSQGLLVAALEHESEPCRYPHGEGCALLACGGRGGRNRPQWARDVEAVDCVGAS